MTTTSAELFVFYDCNLCLVRNSSWRRLVNMLYAGFLRRQLRSRTHTVVIFVFVILSTPFEYYLRAIDKPSFLYRCILTVPTTLFFSTAGFDVGDAPTTLTNALFLLLTFRSVLGRLGLLCFSPPPLFFFKLFRNNFLYDKKYKSI